MLIGMLLVPCAAALAVSGGLLLLARRTPGQKLFWNSVRNVAWVVASARVAILWYVTWREWSRSESLAELPLIVLLFPELLAMPQGRSTPEILWISTGLLVVGSVAMVSAMAWLVRRFA